LPDDYPGQLASWACNLAVRYPVETIRPRIYFSNMQHFSSIPHYILPPTPRYVKSSSPFLEIRERLEILKQKADQQTAVGG